MLRPRVKSVFPPIPIGGNAISIGGADFGLAAELTDDERGHLWQLLQLLDGTRSVAAITSELQARDADVGSQDVQAAIDVLSSSGYLEDAAAPPPVSLSAAELERYARNIEFFSLFTTHPRNGHDLQAQLKQARVTVLGVGGLGSYVALALGAAGVGDLLLVDDDVVEPHNLNRQVLYTGADVGASKVDAARERIAALNPHITVTARHQRVTGVDDARSCFSGRDLVVCAADRPRIVIYDWLNAAAIAEGVAWIRGANDGLTVNSFMHVPGRTACFECEQRHALSRYPWYAALMTYAKHQLGDRTVNPCTAPVAGLIGSLTALEAVKFLTGAATPVTLNRKLIFDLQTMETRFAEGMIDPQCPRCRHLFTPAEGTTGHGQSAEDHLNPRERAADRATLPCPA